MIETFARLAARWGMLSLLAAAGCIAQGGAGSPEASGPPDSPPPQARAHYLANAGVLIERGETKVVFDPLFRNDFGTYQLLPERMEQALFEGEPPFDGLDAVLISHYHEDHFSPADILRLLRKRSEIRLFAPAQAVAGLRAVAGRDDDRIFDRVTEVTLPYGDPPVVIDAGELLVEAVRIPHTGWPERQRDVENIAYRVTLDDETTVVHLGDADARDAHFAQDEDYWSRRSIDVAFPPYWYFSSEEGRFVLEHRLAPSLAIGVHIPRDVPERAEDRPAELRDYDLFVEPGETRDIPR